jgi:mRNA interferase MazF
LGTTARQGSLVEATARYVPQQGDFVSLNFDPQSGHEQAGRRPALVLSPSIYNQRSGMAIVCPVTNTVRGYPFEVATSGNRVSGVILTDQIKSVDWRARKATFIARCPKDALDQAQAKIRALLTL